MESEKIDNHGQNDCPRDMNKKRSLMKQKAMNLEPTNMRQQRTWSLEEIRSHRF